MSNQQLVTRAQLRSYFPVNALTDDHLATLMRDREVEYLCKGQVLFDIGDTDGANVYLVHGEMVMARHASSARTTQSPSIRCRSVSRGVSAQWR
jgi:hypothetical protein